MALRRLIKEQEAELIATQINVDIEIREFKPTVTLF